MPILYRERVPSCKHTAWRRKVPSAHFARAVFFFAVPGEKSVRLARTFIFFFILCNLLFGEAASEALPQNGYDTI